MGSARTRLFLGSTSIVVAGAACSPGDRLHLAYPEPDAPFGRGSDGDVLVATTEILDGCRAVLAIAGDQLTLSDAGPLTGELVVVWQVRGALDTAGRFALARVALAEGTALLLDPPLPLPLSLDGDARAQVCVLREYQNLTISFDGLLAATAWDGERGGFVGFLVAETLTLSGGSVRADGAGLRGAPFGLATLGGTGESHLEGPGPTPSPANGGGGGLCGANNGGGGGGNAGAGGVGGFWTNDTFGCGGPGGLAVGGSPSALLLAGGGGGEGSGEGGSEGSGSAGGGVVFVLARMIAGTGTLSASGAIGENASSDGAGGGGAGGTIRLDFEAESFTGTLSARGGDGGEAIGNHGPGGGGGGGRISGTLPGSGTLLVDGGFGGIATGAATAGSGGAMGVIESR